MFGVKLWFDPGVKGCYRCGAKRPLASPGWFSGQLWCARCLTITGRTC